MINKQNKNEIPILGVTSGQNAIYHEKFEGVVSLLIPEGKVAITDKDGARIKVDAKQLPDLITFLEGCGRLFE